jgi:hypothetical protein
MSTPNLSKGKSKEELLREEVRFWADMQQKYMQWALTVMISLQTAIFFVRRDLVITYVDAGILKKGQELMYSRYLIGTGFLLLCAAVLWRFSSRVNVQYRFYKEQLIHSSESGIKDNPTTGMSGWVRYLYFAFPVFDLFVRIWIDFEIHIH